MPFIKDGPHRIYYRHWRTETAPVATIVFLHGFGENSGLYHRLGDGLSAHGIELWALDQPGHGLSSGEVRGDVGDLARGISSARALVEAARDDPSHTPLFIQGHSLGAAVAAVLLSSDTENTFTGGILSGAPVVRQQWVVDLLNGGSFELTSAKLSSDSFYLDELENDPLALPDLRGTTSLGRVLTAAWDVIPPRAGRIQSPVLVLHGQADPVVPVRTVRQWVGHVDTATIREFPGALHDVLNDREHTKVADAIVEFVNEQVPAR